MISFLLCLAIINLTSSLSFIIKPISNNVAHVLSKSYLNCISSYKHDPSISSITALSSSSSTNYVNSISESAEIEHIKEKDTIINHENRKQIEREVNDMSREYKMKCVESLDIEPLLDIISQFCVTKRGRDALLSIVKKNSNVKSSFLFKNGNSRNARFYSDAILSSNNRNFVSDTGMKLATSVEDARYEYELVQEAIDILKISSQQVEEEATSTYGSSSWPWDVISQIDNNDNIEDDDYDEWLQITNPGDIKLQHALEAEQIVKKIIETYNWCMNIQLLHPKLSNIILNDNNGIFAENIKVLEKLYDDISDRVQIMQVPSFTSGSTKV